MTITFYSESLKIGFADGKFYFLEDGNPQQLIRELHSGRIAYRIPKTSKRFGRTTLEKLMNKCDLNINDIICPF